MMKRMQFGLCVRVVRPRDLTAGMSGTTVSAIIFDEHEETQMAKQKPKPRQQHARAIALPPQKRMPVTVRDPLSRCVVKRK
jgi:hypothetical protein